MEKIGVIGAKGKLGSRILARMQNSLPVTEFEVVGIGRNDDASSLIAGASVIVIAVKGTQVDSVARVMKGKLTSGQLLISLVSGKTIKALQTLFGTKSIVCATTNIFLEIGKGSTVCFAPSEARPAHKDLANTVFLNWGSVYWQEDESVLAGAVIETGCMPAVNATDLRQTIAASKKWNGLNPKLSVSLILDTWAATIERLRLEEDVDQGIEDIVEAVATPAGVTEKILVQLATPTVQGHKMAAFRRAYAFIFRLRDAAR